MPAGSARRGVRPLWAAVSAVLLAAGLLAVVAPAGAAASCVTSDASLVAQVEAKVVRHRDVTGRADLFEMFSSALATMKGEDTYTTSDIKARPDKQGANWQGSGSNPLWQAIYAELDSLEACRDAQAEPAAQDPPPTTAPPPPTPAVSISGGGGVTEGAAATFTVTASPAPASSLTVSLSVSQSGDYAASGATGTKTVTVPASGSVSYSVATVDDSVDEADGSVTVTVASGSGYTVATSSSASVSVADNDDPPPVVPTVSISAGADVTEGGSAGFTVTASPAPASPLSVSLSVSQSGDYAASGATGAKTVTVPASGSVSYSVATVDDSADEADGSVTVTISSASGYTVGSAASATVSVADNDDPPKQTDPAPAEDPNTDPPADPDSEAPWWTPLLTAAAPPEHTVSPLTPRGNDVLVGWPDKAHYKQYRVRATSFEGHDTRWALDHTGNWYVFEDLEPGRWLFMVYDAKGFPHGGLLFFEVAEPGQASQAIHNIKISGAGGVSEGDGATFTLSSTPKPASPLDVTVAISQRGDYAAAGATGAKTVTIPTSGTATFSVATVDDRVDEADGSITVWLSGSGPGYVGTGNRKAVIRVADNDIPEVRVSAGTPGMVEGGTAVFVVSTGLKLASPLTVTLTVGQDGFWTATGTTGTKTVTIPTSGSVPYRVATVNDGTDEAHGAVVVALNDGDGYTVSATQSSARTTVWDNDAAGTSNCRTTDAALAASTESARDAATDSDLVEMLTRSALTLQGRDMYTTADIKTLKQGDAAWQGAGPDALWQKIYTELDRLEVCRGPRVVQIIDNTPGKEQSNLAGANVTITANNTTITEGSDAEFTILVTGIPLPTTALFMVLPKDSAGRSSNDMPQYLKLGAGGTVRLDIPAGGLTTLTVPTQDDLTDEEDGQIWVGVDKGGPEGFGSWVKMTVTDNDETLPASEAKRIPWMKGYWEEKIVNSAHDQTEHWMRIEWGRPQHYRESQLNWWSTWINYCIEVVDSTRPTNGRNRANEHFINGNSSADGGDGPHCRANLQYPGHQGTDDAYNGGGQMTWISAKSRTTYTFDIWVMGDKDASKRTFTFTTEGDKYRD